MGRDIFNSAGAGRLSNAALSEQLRQYQRQARIWLRVGLFGIAGGLIAAAAVQNALLKTALVMALFGGGLCCALLLSGGAQKKLKSLMQEQLGGFFCTELEKAFGPEMHTAEMRIDEPLLKALYVLDRRWEESETENFREGIYHGLHFAAANVRLLHVCEQGGHGQGNLGTSRDMVFKGLVIRCETRVPAASAIRANARAEKCACGAVTGGESFGRRFCVTAEHTEAAQALLTPQFIAWLGRFEQELSGTISGFCWEGHVFSLAVETDYGFASVASNVDMSDLDAVRRSYSTSLREMEKTLALLLENKALFAQQI